jgi:hypothetical protein
VYGLKFNDFINQNRIKHISHNFSNPAWNNLTIEGIATEAGFNSRTTFFNAIKKFTGMSPKEFLQRSKMNNRHFIPSSDGRRTEYPVILRLRRIYSKFVDCVDPAYGRMTSTINEHRFRTKVTSETQRRICLFYSAKRAADSFKQRLRIAVNDTNKVNTLLDLAYLHQWTIPDTAIRYGLEARKLIQGAEF